MAQMDIPRPETAPPEVDRPGGARPGVADPDVAKPELDLDRLQKLLPPHKVVVHDNNWNTFDEVIRVLLRAVPGMTVERAVALTYEVHNTGAAVPYVGPKEQAEAIAERIRTIGIKVTVEPD